ncbi:protein arginine N-methyltransferase 6 isoform X2 [Pseudomyrmex gracilis]|uniref:protein arginine N-methyltransferase 6 isoform X2 n=1 Tax=Pseudomyrmex gracilis TaxID=219809 RepID=UPI00099595EE|nr:protein arginine N-methyltransferase 6 isoform X2 [Pseudomyrmex gracilis]
MDQYFKSYEELDVHQLMLSDKTRVLAYKTAIFNLKHKFQDKVVMDVGAGSEWMGFHLVHEGMLDSVLFARDHFLQEDGLLFPSVAKLYASPCQLPTMYKFWDDICGVSMRCIGEEYRKIKSVKPEVLLINQDDLLAEGKLLVWLDLKCISLEELNLLGGEDYVSVCKKNGRYQGMCIWFAVEFPDGSELSTGPQDKATHWKQTAVVLPTDIEVTKHEPIAYKLELKRDLSNSRHYNMELSMLDTEEVEHDVPCGCHMTKCIVTKAYIENNENVLNEVIKERNE